MSSMRLDMASPGILVLVSFAALLLFILIVSFRSRARVFCQYLQAMTGIVLSPAEVRRVYKQKGKDGVRELFLDLIIREDLKAGPLPIGRDETDTVQG